MNEKEMEQQAVIDFYILLVKECNETIATLQGQNDQWQRVIVTQATEIEKLNDQLDYIQKMISDINISLKT